MYIVDPKIVYLVRGDSFKYPLYINNGTDLSPERYELKDSDKVYIGITQPNQSFENAIIKKVLTTEDVLENGDLLFKLDPEDTVCVCPGKYFYEIKLRTLVEDTYEVHTIANKQQFWIIE